jgi:hypothetical protein
MLNIISIFKWFINNLIVLLLINNLNKILSMPTFDRHLENVTVIIGNTAVLPCYINNLGDHKVSSKDILEIKLGVKVDLVFFFGLNIR